MARVSAQEWLTKWGTNLNASGQYIKSGVSKVSTAPGIAAAASADRMLAGITAAVTSGMWAKRVASVSLADWQSAMINKGIAHIAQGVSQAQKTKLPEIQALLSAIDSVQSEVSALPKGGLENNVSRAVAWMRGMSAAAPKRKGL